MRVASAVVAVLLLGVLRLGAAMAGEGPQPIEIAQNLRHKVAQNVPQNQAGQAGGQSVRGCAIGGDGGYVLRDSNGEEWRFAAASGSPRAGDKDGAGQFLKQYVGYEIVVSGAAAGRHRLEHARVKDVIGSCMAEPDLMYQPEG